MITRYLMDKDNPSPTANEAWVGLLHTILDCGDITNPRGLKTVELLGKQTVFDMNYPIVTSANRKLGYRFMAAEAWWILSGSNRLDEIKPYSKMIEKFSDDGFTFRGAYGPKVMEQVPYVVDTLLKDPDSRQAVMTIWRERPGPSKDIPCTVSAQWVLRRDREKALRLHCFVNMRSSDAWLGVPYDWFNFSMISLFIATMLHDLQEKNAPQCVERIYLGDMCFTAGSQHLYEQHWEPAKDCTFDDKELFKYEPINPFDWERDPYELVSHLKSLADHNVSAFNDGEHCAMFTELLDIKKETPSDDGESAPRGY